MIRVKRGEVKDYVEEKPRTVGAKLTKITQKPPVVMLVDDERNTECILDKLIDVVLIGQEIMMLAEEVSKDYGYKYELVAAIKAVERASDKVTAALSKGVKQ